MLGNVKLYAKSESVIVAIKTQVAVALKSSHTHTSYGLFPVQDGIITLVAIIY